MEKKNNVKQKKIIIINFDILKTQVSGSQGLLVGRNGGSKAEIKVELEDA